MEFAKGVKVPFPDKIKEEYQLDDNCITANIDIDNLEGVLIDFVEMAAEPLYIGIHVPLEEDDEKKLRKSDEDPFHERVYYLDNCRKEDMRLIIDTFMDILINDGLSKFVIASQESGDEMFVQKYKVTSFFSENISEYEELMKTFSIEKSDNITTVMDTFTQENPGMCTAYENNDGINIYDLVNALSQAGMYPGEIVEA